MPEKEEKVKKRGKIQKKDTAKNLLEYTSRDMGQEYLMRRRMWDAIVIAILASIGLFIFLALFVSEIHNTQETYRTQYTRAIENASYDIQEYIDLGVDKEFRYRMIFSEISTANTFASMLDDFTDEGQTVNEFYTVFLKYPQQVDSRMDEILVIVNEVRYTNSEAYVHMQEFVDSIDKKGY